MNTVPELYARVREQFPQISLVADRRHHRRWGDTLEVGIEYAWFEALADALNTEMHRGVAYSVHRPLFQFIEGSFFQGSEAVRQCIDVSFVENLFAQVPGEKCAPYWERLPSELKRLYTEFHRRDPQGIRQMRSGSGSGP